MKINMVFYSKNQYYGKLSKKNYIPAGIGACFYKFGRIKRNKIVKEIRRSSLNSTGG